jgi:hypothetical protein
MIIIWIIIAMILLYLLVGLGIYAVGTQNQPAERKSIVRQANKKLVFKDEAFKVKLKVSTRELPPQKQEKHPWNIVLVIDKSVSMRFDSALNHAKEAAKNLITSTPGNFNYGIVEFESSARICSRLTNQIPKLRAAVDKIISSGSTAIHEGLRLAYDLIDQDPHPDRKNAVILLSDGGSDEAPALEQANLLKEKGVIIYTIGLGQCHRQLMKRIAADEEKFFYAEKIEELKEFFFAVGRDIQNAEAKDVIITEYPALTQKPLRLSKLGDIRPMEMDLYHQETPFIKWYLPGLEKEHTTLEYELRPRCYGWYPSTYEKAGITMQSQNNETLAFHSNKGPYVLVIPRFFLWQVLWIFLNPLLWMMIQKRTCKCQEFALDRKYKDPGKLTASAIEKLPLLNPAYPVGVTPTLVIGLGFGGMNAITHLKRLLWEHNEEDKIKQKVTLLGIDTVKPYFADRIISGTVELEPTEKMFLQTPISAYISDEAGKSSHEKEYPWLDAKGLSAEGVDYDIGSGTHFNRQIGRLNYIRTRENINRIKTLLKTLHDNNPGEPLNVCLTGTLTGGTSTGMTLDLSYSIKKIIKELEIPGIGINLVLMDASLDPDETQAELKKSALENNKQAFLHELARYFATRNTADAPLPGDEPLNKWFDHIIQVEKKPGTPEQFDLYPQAGVFLYQWIVEKSFRDFVVTNAGHISHGLLVHRFQAQVVFLFKRILEDYFAARLLLTVIGNLILGIDENPGNYTLKSAKINTRAVETVLELLLTRDEWKNAIPLLLLSDALIKKPAERNFSHFLTNGGLAGITGNATPEDIENFLSKETDVFEKLIFSWIELIMSGQDFAQTPGAAEALSQQRLPTAHRSLLELKQNLETIKDFSGSISDSESTLDRQQCVILLEMCERFIPVLDRWINVFEKWAQILGEGTSNSPGICRRLNHTLDKLERAIESTRLFKTPHFVMDKSLKDNLYQGYFLHLEAEILQQMQWEIKSPGTMIFRIATPRSTMEFDIEKEPQALINDIIKAVTSLPGYFAARKNQWNAFTLEDFMAMSREMGNNIEEKYLYPAAREVENQCILSLNPSIFSRLQNQVSLGIEHKKLEVNSPFLTGFFKYQFNHEILKTAPAIKFDVLPPFVFTREWNCYHALCICRNLTRKEVLPPSYPLVILCKDMKKFLGVVKKGIIDNQIKTVQVGAQMVFQFEPFTALEISKTDEADTDLYNLVRLVIESPEPAVLQMLTQGFTEILELEPKSLEESIHQTRIPLSPGIKNQFCQVTIGASAYFRHMENTAGLPLSPAA